MVTRTAPRGRNMLEGAMLMLAVGNALAHRIATITSAIRSQRSQRFRVHCSVPLLFLARHPAAANDRAGSSLSSYGAAGLKSRQPSVEWLSSDRYTRRYDSTGAGSDRCQRRRRNVGEANREYTGSERNHRSHFPRYGDPVAGLMVGLSPFGPARVTNSRTPGVKSLALITRRAIFSR